MIMELYYKYELNNSAFPHKDRVNGHVYNGQHYNVKNHYSDKSVINIYS